MVVIPTYLCTPNETESIEGKKTLNSKRILAERRISKTVNEFKNHIRFHRNYSNLPSNNKLLVVPT